MKIVIIDYGIGNVQSITNILLLYGDMKVILSSDEQEILNADAVILPGVGAFKKAMEELQKRDLPNKLRKFIDTKKPFLGICLGMQLLFDKSEEFGMTNGLGFIKGKVKKFPDVKGYKLPHVAWCNISKGSIDWKNTILKNTTDNDSFYFVHTFICYPDDQEVILSTTNYCEVDYCSSILSDNIYATQFHPEKSAASGIKVIKNFIELIKKK
jgi:imidazole glycerol-phosphate synthase subunit HisH